MRQHPENLEKAFALVRSRVGDSLRIFFSQVAINQGVPEIDDWCQQYGNAKLINVVGNADGNNLLIRENSRKSNV